MDHTPRRVNPTLSYKLIQTLRQRAAQKRGTSEAGASILLVLLVTLILILGTATLASRGFQGLIGSVFLGQRREAAAAAELGASWFISQMNREGNRALLVNSTEDNQGLQPPGTAFATSNIGNNLCLLGSTAPVPNDGDNKLFSSSGVYTWYVLDDNTITDTAPTGGDYRSFTLLNVGQPSYSGSNDDPDDASSQEFGLRIDRNRNFGDLTVSGTQPLYLQVEGSSYRDGERVASIVLEKEYEVVPKCCGRSFGREHGNDPYEDILGSEQDVCVPDTIDISAFSILTGAGEGPGGFSIKGGSASIATVDGEPIDPLICFNDVSSDEIVECTNSFNPPRDDQPVVNLNTTLPPPPNYCVGSGVGTQDESGCISAEQTLSLADMAAASSPVAPLVTTPDGKSFEFFITTADTTSLPSNCISTAANGITTIHCNVDNWDDNQLRDITIYTWAPRKIVIGLDSACYTAII